MSRRNLILIIIAAIMLITAGIIFVFSKKSMVNVNQINSNGLINPNTTPGSLFQNNPDSNSAPKPSTGNTNAPAVNTPPAAVVPSVDPKNALRRTSMLFAEKWGSYSNQGDFSNILDLKYLMTQNLKNYADQYVAGQNKNQDTIYKGFTTRSLVVSFSLFDEAKGLANTVVTTQREETTGNASIVYRQNLNLNFIKEKGEWKIDSAIWGNKQ